MILKKQQRSCKYQIQYISTHIGPYQEWNEYLKYTITVFKYCQTNCELLHTWTEFSIGLSEVGLPSFILGKKVREIFKQHYYMGLPSECASQRSK